MMKVVLICIVAGGCAAQPAPMAPAASAYLDAALKIMEEHFYHKERIDWRALVHATTLQAAGAQTSVDTYPAIRFALAKLGDGAVESEVVRFAQPIDV